MAGVTSPHTHPISPWKEEEEEIVSAPLHKKDGRDFAKTKGRGEQSVPKDYLPVILLPSMLRWLGCTGCLRNM